MSETKHTPGPWEAGLERRGMSTCRSCGYEADLNENELCSHCRGAEIGVSVEVVMTDEQIKRAVDRFLQWKLPETFNPDGGISFKRMRNENTPWPAKNEPVGTNLLDAQQAEEMIRYILKMPCSPIPSHKESQR